MTEQATLMFGIGATKAGTSWIYRYLLAHPECALPAVKELHYFNSEDPKFLDSRIAGMERKIRQIEWNGERKEGIDQALSYLQADSIRRAMRMLKAPRAGDAAYKEFLLQHFEDGAKLTADITPAYALLSAERMKDMLGLHEKTRFLYILRDPVDRLWSNVRMTIGRVLKPGQNLGVVSNRALDNLIHKGQRPALLERSDYAGTLAKLDQVVPQEKLKVVFFEELFREDTVRDICAFLDISYQPAELKKKVHEGRPVAMRPELKIAARALLEDQYQAMERRFGDLPKRWKRDFAKVA